MTIIAFAVVIKEAINIPTKNLKKSAFFLLALGKNDKNIYELFNISGVWLLTTSTE